MIAAVLGRSGLRCMGLNALMLLQHARSSARVDGEGEAVLLEAKDRRKWNAAFIAEGLAVNARAATAAETAWAQIELLYAKLERMQPSPVVTLNRAVAVAKTRGGQAALDVIEPLQDRLAAYFHFHGLHGHLLLRLGRQADARTAFMRAIGPARRPAEANHIRLHLDRLTEPAPSQARP